MRVFINNVEMTDILDGSISITRRANGERSLSVSLFSLSQNLYKDGDEVEVFREQFGTGKLFGGIINSYLSSLLSQINDEKTFIQIDIQSDGYGVIPQRRIVNVSYTNTNIRTMVLALLSQSNLGAETIFVGTITPEADLPTISYSAQFKTIAEVLDELAAACGHIWYIDDARALHFIETPGPTNAPYQLNTFNGTFTDFHDLTWSGSIENYANKVFVVGDNVSQSYESTSEIALRQAEASGQGTGVYSIVIEDSNVKSLFQAGVVANQHLRTYAIQSSNISFSTYTEGFQPGQKLQVRIWQITGYDPNPPRLPQIWYYLIEEVTLERESGGVTKYTVNATRRNNGNFSTQKTAGYKDYFKTLVKKG